MRDACSGLACLTLAALPVFTLAGAQAADMRQAPPAARTLTVTRTVSACPPLPTVVARGRRGVGEPGSFYATWDWVVPTTCDVANRR